MPRVGTFDLLGFAGCGVADRDLGLLIEVGFSSRVGDDKGVYVYVVVVVETVTVLVVAYKEDGAGNRIRQDGSNEDENAYANRKPRYQLLRGYYAKQKTRPSGLQVQINADAKYCITAPLTFPPRTRDTHFYTSFRFHLRDGV